MCVAVRSKAVLVQGGVSGFVEHAMSEVLWNPGHLKPVILKLWSSDFEISDLKAIQGKCGKCERSIAPLKKQGSEETPQSENVENTDTETPKM